jgi:hypothetical protein
MASLGGIAVQDYLIVLVCGAIAVHTIFAYLRETKRREKMKGWGYSPYQVHLLGGVVQKIGSAPKFKD